MTCSHRSSGSLQPIVDPLNEAAQCALDTLQGVQIALSIPQEAERTKQLEKAPCGPGVSLVSPPGAEVTLTDVEGVMPGHAVDLAMTDFPILPGRRALTPWVKEAAETIDGFLQGRYMRLSKS